MMLSRKGLLEKFQRNAQQFQPQQAAVAATAQPSSRKIVQFRSASLTAGQNTRNRFKTVDQQAKHAPAKGLNQLDPRELYRAKNQRNTTDGLLMTTRHLYNSMEPTNQKQVGLQNQTFFSRRSKTNKQTSYCHKPFSSQQSPRNAETKLPQSLHGFDSSQNQATMTCLNNRLPGRPSIAAKLNQTLMSFQNRKSQLPHVHFNRQPRDERSPMAQLLHGRPHQKAGGEYEVRSSLAGTNESFDSTTNPVLQEMAQLTQLLEPLRQEEMRDHFVDQFFSSPQMPRQRNKTMNLTAINFRNGNPPLFELNGETASIDYSQSGRNEMTQQTMLLSATPETPQKSTQHARESDGGGDHDRLPMTTKTLCSEVKSGIVLKKKSPVASQTQQNLIIGKANGARKSPSDYNSSKIKIGKLSNVAKNAISEEKNSALFNPDSGYFQGSSQNDERNGRPLITEFDTPQSTDILTMAAEIVHQQRCETQEDEATKRLSALLDPKKDSFKKQKRSTMEINNVPIAIAKKSSKMAVSKKTSGKLPLQSSNSFISMTSPSPSRIQVKKLASFNDDLRDVVKVKDLVVKTVPKSRKNSASNFKKDRLAYEPPDITSKETLRPNHQDYPVGEDVVMASIETFNQKMQMHRPPRLEIKTKAKVLKNLIIPSNENTPTKAPVIVTADLDSSGHKRAKKNEGGGFAVSSLTLTISQQGFAEGTTPVRKSPRKIATSRKVVPQPAMFESPSPLIIQTNNLEHRKNPRKQAKLTLEERTLDKIAKLRANNSITIDINALDPAANLTGTQAPIKSTLPADLKKADEGRRSQSALTQSQLSAKEIHHSGKSGQESAEGQPIMIQSEQNRGSSKLLRNPLILTKIETQSQAGAGGNHQTGKVYETMLASRDSKNQDIQDVVQSSAFKRPRESSIGVGSVVLHLRKNKNAINQADDGNMYPQAVNLNSDEATIDDFDTVGSGDNRRISSRGGLDSRLHLNLKGCEGFFDKYPKAELPKTVIVDTSPRNYSISQRHNRSIQPKTLTSSGAAQAIKNGQVLRQKPFTNLVRTGKSQNGEPLTLKNTSPRISRGPQTQREKKGAPTTSVKGKPQQFQLIGTQKEQVEQPLRQKQLKYPMQRRHLRNASMQPKASFIVPHYFHDSVNLNIVQNSSRGAGYMQENQFGETLTGQPTQMHQLITLQNGQMMIRKIDVVAFQQNDIINFDQNVATPSSWQELNTGAFKTANSSNGFQYTPLTNRPQEATSPSPSVFTPPIANTPSTVEAVSRGGGPRRQYLELPHQFQHINLNQSREKESAVAIETVCGTDKSLASLQQHFVNTVDQSHEIVTPHDSIQTAGGFVSQTDHYRAVADETNSFVDVAIPNRRKMTENYLSAKQKKEAETQILLSENQPASQSSFSIAQVSASNSRGIDQRAKQIPADLVSVINNAKSEGLGDDQASYNYLHAAGHYLQPNDERMIEQDESIALALPEVVIDQGDGPEQRIRNIMVDEADGMAQQDKFAEQQSRISPRKMVVFKQSPKQIVNRSMNSQDSEYQQLMGGINTAKLMSMPASHLEQPEEPVALINVKTLSDDEKDDQSEQSPAILKVNEEDPVLRKKRGQKKVSKEFETPQSPSHRVNDFNGSLKPWEDNDILLNQRRGRNPKPSQSLDTRNNFSVQKSFDNAKKDTKLGKISSKQNSSIERLSNRKSKPQMPQTQYLQTRQSYELRSKQKIVVQDKAQQSHRQQQEKQMRDIVFDDEMTPGFRFLESSADDKQALVSAVQTSTIVLGENEEEMSPSWNGMNDDQMASRGSILPPQPSSDAPQKGSKAASKLSQLKTSPDDKFKSQGYDPVVAQAATGVSFQSSSFFSKKDEVVKKPQLSMFHQQQKGTSQKELDATATFGRRKYRRKGPPMEGEEFGYIEDDRIDSYYK